MKKTPGPNNFSGEFYQTLKENNNTNSSRTLPGNWRRQNAFHYILWDQDHSNTKTWQRSQEKKTKDQYPSVTYMQKFLTKMFNKLNSMLNVKDNIYMTKWGLFQECRVEITLENQSI